MLIKELDVRGHPQFDGHERVVYFEDEKTGLKSIIAVHNTTLGPGLGGCRVYPYGHMEEAEHDVLRLARGMTYKSALAGLPLGGGKAVILANPRTDKTEYMMESFGAAVEAMGGRYVTAEDVGTVEHDMIAIARKTKHVTGLPPLPQKGGGVSGNPSPITAYGVFCGLKACARVAFGSDDLKGVKVAVQGLGAVGFSLCQYLHEAGAYLVVADVNEQNVTKALVEFTGAVQSVPADQILFQDVDILAPCAMGAILNDETIPLLRTKVVAGAANNQLAAKDHDKMLKDMGILYGPDYAINSGGVTSVGYEYFGRSGNNPYPYALTEDTMMKHVGRIYDTMLNIFDIAQAENISTGRAADMLAEKIFHKHDK